MRRLSLLVSFGMLSTALALGAEARENPAQKKPAAPKIALKNWVMSRMRIGKKIEVKFNLENQDGTALVDVRGRLTFFEPLGSKLREGPWTRVGRVEPGRTLPVTLVVGNVPDFGGWEMELACRAPDAVTLAYFGSSPYDPPQPKSDELLQGAAQAVILGYEVTERGRYGPTLTVRLKNAGAREARDVKICIEFVDKKGKPISDETVPLDKGGALGPGEERVFRARLQRMPRQYSGYRVRARNATLSLEESLSGGEFTKDATVQVAHVRLERLEPEKPDGVRPLRVSAEVKNGTTEALVRCVVTFVFTEKPGGGKVVLRRPAPVEGELAAGAVKPVSFTLDRPPEFGGLTCEIESEAGGDEISFPPVTRAVAEGRVDVSRVAASYDGKIAVFTTTVASRAKVECTDVVVRFTLTRARGGSQVPVARGEGRLARIAPGASEKLTVRIKAPEGFEKYTFQVSYEDPSRAQPIEPGAE